MSTYKFFATTAKNIEPLLLEELKNCKATNVKGTHLGVAFEGDIEVALRACLWSRLAHHVFLELKVFEAPTREALYQAVKTVNWMQHFKETQTFRIDVSGKHPTLTHPHFIAQIAKDAIVDQFRDKTGNRPSIEAERPDIVLQLHVRENRFVLYLDLSGESLHRRGIRTETGAAPLKETLAAALLIRAGWCSPSFSKGEMSHSDRVDLLFDPMCGAGTLLLEGAMMAYDVAPGLYRTYFGFLGWRQHNSEMWKKLIQEAKLRQQQALHTCQLKLVGYDINPRILAACEQNFKKLGLIKNIQLEKREAWNLPNFDRQGLLISNPPYGKRLMAGQDTEIETLYAKLGEAVKQHLEGWKMAIFTENPMPVKAVRMRPAKQYQFLNGTLECTLITFVINPENYWQDAKTTP